MLYVELFFVFLPMFGVIILEFYDYVFYENYARSAIRGDIDNYLIKKAKQSKFKGMLAMISGASLVAVGLINYYQPVLIDFFQVMLPNILGG